ncbi:hypothetical protein HZC07_00855, partial [Candidatus Micrarchaeota archaeon]|nr:hypothetical protein [Candidatus Micrarchaeota archaeon]
MAPNGTQNRLQFVLHNGIGVVDSKSIPRELRETNVLGTLNGLYGPSVETKYYENLGTELTGLQGIRRDENSGFQLYLAIVRDGQVEDMGLPYITTASGQTVFLGLETIKVGDIENALSSLPQECQIALVLRLDRDMTQDIEIKETSITGA